MKEIDDIRRDWEHGAYICNMKTPSKVKENHVFDENLSVKKNREMAIEHNEMVNRMRKEKVHKQAELDNLLHNDVIEYILDHYDMNESQAKAVEYFAYTLKHSFIGDYFSFIDELALFVEDILKDN